MGQVVCLPRKEMMGKKRYVPEVGDTVKLVQLHPEDAYYRERCNKLNEEMIVCSVFFDAVEHNVAPKGFCGGWFRTKSTGEEICFYAAKFEKVE